MIEQIVRMIERIVNMIERIVKMAKMIDWPDRTVIFGPDWTGLKNFGSVSDF